MTEAEREKAGAELENHALLAVTEAQAGERLDAAVAAMTGISRAAVVRLLENGLVTVNDRNEEKKYKVKSGDRIFLQYPEPEVWECAPENIPLSIVYEDADIVVVNKPSGMVVHPAPGNPNGTLANALMYHCGSSLSGVGGVIRPGIVHRIDKDTSGLLVVAKNDAAHAILSDQLKTHTVRRVYYAILCGNLREEEGTVNAPIGRNPADRKKMAVVRDSAQSAKPAVTHYQVLERFPGFTFVRCELETGRTHQIRVHMAMLGHPILGDPLYGGENTAFWRHNQAEMDGQCLHAGELHLIHPSTREEMHFSCELPDNMQRLLQKLRKMSR